MKKSFFITLSIGFLLIGLPVQADELNKQVDFYIDSEYDILGRDQLPAVLMVKSNQAYFYVDVNYWDKLTYSEQSVFKNKLKSLAKEFDQVIYPRERAIFGSEWSPGIDNDPRITILVLELVDDAGGYFNTNDGYYQSLAPRSNQREMVYLNAKYIIKPRAKAFLAHEFQHLITFYQKSILYGLEEDVWLNEARSEYAPTLCGYDNVYANSNLEKRVDVFLDTPADSLTEWRNELADYGVSNLFLNYLVGHYGEGVLTKMVLNNKVGIASIDQAMKDMGYSKRFADIFADWAVANYLNNCEIGSGKYCYRNDNLNYYRLHVDPTSSYSGFPNLIVSRSSSIRDWAMAWYRFRPGPTAQTSKDVLKLEFTGSQRKGDFEVPYFVIKQDGRVDVNFIPLVEQKGAVYIDNFISSVDSVVIAPFNRYKTSHFSARESPRQFTFTASSMAGLPLVINSISPKSGPSQGGTELTLKGENLSDIEELVFGEQKIMDFRVIDDQTIIFEAPAHSTGSVDLLASDIKGEQFSLANAFSYLKTYGQGSLIRTIGDYKVYIIKGNYRRWVQTAEIFNQYAHLRWEDIIDISPEEMSQFEDAWLIRADGDPRVYELNADGTKHWLNMTAEEFTISGRKWDMVYIVNSFERDSYKTGSDVRFK